VCNNALFPAGARTYHGRRAPQPVVNGEARGRHEDEHQARCEEQRVLGGHLQLCCPQDFCRDGFRSDTV